MGSTRIVQEPEAWNYVDKEISGLPENAAVYHIASNGIYYMLELNTDYSGAEPTSENEFHFLDFSGSDKMLLRMSGMNTYSIARDGDKMLLCNVTSEGMEILALSPDGDVETVFTQNAPQFPFIQTYEQYMVSIRNNFVDGSGMYENALVLRDGEKNEETVIYRALWDNEKATGEDLGCVSVTNETICFTLNRYFEDKESEFVLFLYDIPTGTIVAEVPLRTRVYYAAYGEAQDSLLLSETDDYTYIEEAGALGYMEESAFVEQAKIPLISASNMIRDGAYSGEGYYFTTYQTAYYWDIGSNEVYVYDYQWLGDSKYRMTPTSEGLKFVVVDGGRTFVRTLAVK